VGGPHSGHFPIKTRNCQILPKLSANSQSESKKVLLSSNFYKQTSKRESFLKFYFEIEMIFIVIKIEI